MRIVFQAWMSGGPQKRVERFPDGDCQRSVAESRVGSPFRFTVGALTERLTPRLFSLLFQSRRSPEKLEPGNNGTKIRPTPVEPRPAAPTSASSFLMTLGCVLEDVGK